MKVERTDIDNWETDAIDRGNWGSVVKTGMEREENRREVQQAERRGHRKERSVNVVFSSHPTVCVCRRWGRDCHARLGLLSHASGCISQT